MDCDPATVAHVVYCSVVSVVSLACVLGLLLAVLEESDPVTVAHVVYQAFDFAAPSPVPRTARRDTHTQNDRQTDRQTDRHTHTHTHTHEVRIPKVLANEHVQGILQGACTSMIKQNHFIKQNLVQNFIKQNHVQNHFIKKIMFRKKSRGEEVVVRAHTQ